MNISNNWSNSNMQYDMFGQTNYGMYDIFSMN